MEAAAKYPARGVDGGHEVESYELEFSTRVQCSPAAYYWATVRKARDTLKGPIKGAVRRDSHYTRPQTERSDTRVLVLVWLLVRKTLTLGAGWARDHFEGRKRSVAW